jgi:hypothetical protein
VTEDGTVDASAQRALTRYYLEAGASGLAVGVHTTQFELHDDPGLLRMVWELAAGEAHGQDRSVVLVAGVVGGTDRAVAEAQVAAELGYDAVLLAPWAMGEASEAAQIQRAAAIGEVLPVIGFYLQRDVGGHYLSRTYWQRLFDLESVVAVKAAPFDRYRTGDVAQSLLSHDRWGEIALLTGNDDSIVHDLTTVHHLDVGGQRREIRARGGLLGQWAVGTRAAVDLVSRINTAMGHGCVPTELLSVGSALVEVNGAVFDAVNSFAGCVPGVNEVLRQQGILATASTLGEDSLSPGQSELIAQARSSRPELLDESFVAAHRDGWFS